MTIKLPEPDGYLTVEKIEDCGHSIEHTIKKVPVYTADTVKRLIRDALDEAAKTAEQAAETVNRMTMGRWCAEAIRKLKEQLK